jgi:hypothetical protein
MEITARMQGHRLDHGGIVALSGSHEGQVDALDDAAVARYLTLRTLAQVVSDATRESESRARLEIALALQRRIAR